jgi:hypothetical protein
MVCLQAATAACTLALPAGLLEVAAGVEEVVAAAAGVLVVVVELLVLELLLPQPATNAPHRSTATSHEDRLRIILSPPLD